MRIYDPRTKLVVVIALSSLGVVIKDASLLALVLVVGIIVSHHFGASMLRAYHRLKKLLVMLFLIAVLQSLFNGQGEPLLVWGDFTFLTSGGLMRGVEFLLRMAIVLLSATIVATADEREMVQGLVQSKVPYELAFMVSLGVRFLPMLAQELQDTMVALQLRGIELKKIPWRSRLETYVYLLLPVLVGTIKKAEAISLSMETKGFRARHQRSSFRRLRFAPRDVVWMIGSTMSACMLLVLYWQ